MPNDSASNCGTEAAYRPRNGWDRGRWSAVEGIFRAAAIRPPVWGDDRAAEYRRRCRVTVFGAMCRWQPLLTAKDPPERVFYAMRVSLWWKVEIGLEVR